MSYNDNSTEAATVTILLVIVAIVGAISYSKCSGGDHKSAEHEFKAWAKSLDLRYDHATCNNHDGDGDGYVSCTYTVDGHPMTVECAGSWTMQSGCRTPKMRVQATAN